MVRSLLLAAALLACNRGSEVELPQPVAPEVFTPAPATLHRLTDTWYRNSVEDLLGVSFTGELPVDYVLHGYVSVGASELTIAPLDLELYETAAWEIAAAAAPDQDAAEALLGCTLGTDEAGDALCVRGFAASFGRRAWRRPPTGEELDELEALYLTVKDLTNETVATQSVMAAVLQSPSFLFRVELGEPGDAPSIRRYTSWEMASRLSYFLLDTTPDEALLAAAEAGSLVTDDGLRLEAERLLDDPRAAGALSGFFAETLELGDLELVDKDTTVHPEFTDDLKAAMGEELRQVFAELVLVREEPFTNLLTTDLSYVDPSLAALYGVAGTGFVTLPPEQERGGILGRAAIMAIHSHNTLTSPTQRGKFVRARLLCQSISPPPAGIDTSLDESETDGTMRDMLEQHATDPACASCHDAMDPIGFALEHFDPIGRWRALDNGLPIDATGDLDGVPFDGAVELGAAVAGHPELPICIALQLYRDAAGRAESVAELPALDALAASFAASGMSFRGLVLELVLSDAFRTATAPVGEACEDEGTTRSCATDCGEGVERCIDGLWQRCSAPAPADEHCNGADDDCDGAVDEDVERSCDSAFGPGTELCVDGGWSACEGPPPGPETCNGFDDDGDGSVDEDLAVAITTVTPEELTAEHEDCDAAVDPISPSCHAATHRLCAATACGTSGWSAVALRASDLDVVCVDATVLETTFTTLASHHGVCDGAVERQGPNCNAAISRFCGSQGLTTGFGPVENSGDIAVVTCTPTAAVFETTYTELVTFDPSCDGAGQRWGQDCNEAIHEWCVAEGYETGHGPLENSGDIAVVACMGD